MITWESIVAGAIAANMVSLCSLNTLVVHQSMEWTIKAATKLVAVGQVYSK